MGIAGRVINSGSQPLSLGLKSFVTKQGSDQTGNSLLDASKITF